MDIPDRNSETVHTGLLHEARGFVSIREAGVTVIHA
jgi:hypothetical protein